MADTFFSQEIADTQIYMVGAAVSLQRGVMKQTSYETYD
jgi:hypothetical protein